MTQHPDTTEWDRMRREQRSRHQDEAMTGRHVIADVTYALERIECTCDAVITAGEDELVHDRHAPLVAAWEAHKREARSLAPAPLAGPVLTVVGGGTNAIAGESGPHRDVVERRRGIA